MALALFSTQRKGKEPREMESSQRRARVAVFMFLRRSMNDLYSLGLDFFSVPKVTYRVSRIPPFAAFEQFHEHFRCDVRHA